MWKAIEISRILALELIFIGMEYSEEIKETREGIDRVKQSGNFANSLKDKELDNFTYLSPEDTNTPYKLWVDSNMEYLKQNHLLCAYVTINGEDVIPVIISNTPYLVGDIQYDMTKTLAFISRNYLPLVAYANREIDSDELYDEIDKSYNESLFLTEEMQKTFH